MPFLFVRSYSALLGARILRVRNFLAKAGSLSCGSFPCSYSFTLALAVLRLRRWRFGDGYVCD